MKVLEATIKLEYDDEKTARAVADAISPENLRCPEGVLVKTRREKCCVTTEIKVEGKVSTFIATIDDLLFSVSLVERTLKVARGDNLKD